MNAINYISKFSSPLIIILLTVYCVNAQITIKDTSKLTNFVNGGIHGTLTFQHDTLNDEEILFVGVSNNSTLLRLPIAGLPVTGLGCLTRPLALGGTVTNITYTAQGMTQNMERLTTDNVASPNAVSSPNGCSIVEVFRLVDPPTGTGTISVSVPLGGDYLVLGAVSFSGVRQTALTGGELIDSSGISSMPASAPIPTDANDLVFDVIAAEFAAGRICVGILECDTNGSQIRRYNGDFSSLVDIGAGSTKPSALGSSTTTMWRLDQAGEWALGGVRLDDAATAASVSIGGQVRKTDGTPLPSSLVILQNLNTGEQLYAHTNEKGKYVFEELEVGISYNVRVYNYKYEFAPNSQTFSLTDNLGNVDFVGKIRRRNLTIGEIIWF